MGGILNFHGLLAQGTVETATEGAGKALGALQNLQAQFMEHIPKVAGALGILVVGWLIALVAAAVIRTAIRKTGLNRKLGQWLVSEPGDEPPRVDVAVSKGVFYILMLFVAIATCEALGLKAVTEPLNSFLNQIFEYAPRIIGAGAALLVAWLVATVLKFVVSKALTAAKIDRRLGQQAEAGEDVPVTRTISEAVYWLVFLLFLPVVLDALEMPGLLEPVQGMVSQILGFLPNLLAASIIVIAGWFIGKIVGGLAKSVLLSIGFNDLPEKLGLGSDVAASETSPSEMAGKLVQVAIVLFATLQAVPVLGFEVLGELMTEFMVFASQVLMGLVIFAFGLYLAKLASEAIEASGSPNAQTLSLVARVAILGLAGAMGLQRMGLATDIVNLAFGLILGGIAVALAISFGIGGRDAAKTAIDKFMKSSGGGSGGGGSTRRK